LSGLAYQPHLRAITASGLPPRQVEFPPPGAAAVCPGPGRFRAQSSGPPHQSNDQDDEQQEKDQEQDPGNLDGAGRDAGKAEQPAISAMTRNITAWRSIAIL